MPTKARPTKPAAPAKARRTGTGTPPRRRRLLGALIAAAVCAATAGGYAVYRTVSGDDAAAERPVTVDEASRLALSRLTLYQASPATVTLTATEGGGVSIEVTGIVDYRAHRGVGSYRTLGVPAAAPAPTPAPTAGPRTDRGLIVWDTGGLGLAPAPEGESGPPWQQAEHVPRTGWSPRAYTTDPLDAGLQLLVQLGADRPDNPLLLAQSGARWLGHERIDGRDYDRFSGPRAQGSAPDGARSPLTYWLDGDGGLRRVTMRMPGLGTPTTMEFTGRDAAAKLPDAPWAAG
ncbi:hypothetical protein [Streptomyces sp. NRRL WC-3742]|uniref:hypothetical protein n=1 Tax=Streptomyces sp. NRRL WC-3742 TaxID=1463934 RepID=UPI000A60F6AF|nr:hypothetical protein [Streptomyces sp. NRRL WC-3742]